MKKLLISLVLGIFLISLLSINAVLGDNNETGNQTGTNQTNVCSPACDSDEICLNSTCVDNDSDDNETEDDDENETEDDNNEAQDEYSGCTNITNETLCEAKKNCDYNNATQKCVKTAKTKKLKESLQAYLNSTECPEDCVCAGSTIKCETENGREMTVVAGKSGNIIIITKTVNASTSAVLIKNSTGLYGNFSGKIKKIKYLPDEIKEKVLKKLKLTDAASSNIVLNEDGTYEMTINGKYRVLWLFPKKTTVVTEINSETGEVTVLKKPWWKFRAD